MSALNTTIEVDNNTVHIVRRPYIRNIVVECTPDDVESPALNGLTLEILEVEDGQLDLEKVSETTQWKHGGVFEIPLWTNCLSIVALSKTAGNIGYISLVKGDWDEIQGNPSGNYLKRNFEMGNVALKLFLSLEVKVATSDEMSQWMSARNNPTPRHTFLLSCKDDNPLKADGLNLCGHHFLSLFRITWGDKDVCEAITAYTQAASCLSVDDPRLGTFLNDIGVGYQLRYERFRWINDLQKAIATRQIAIAITPEKHADFSDWLCKLGITFSFRFQLSGDLDDISEAIEKHRRAVQLTPDGHAGLPGRLSNLGNSLSHRFKYTGDLDDISEAIRNQRHAVQLTSMGHASLSGRLNNLGKSLLGRFERTGDMDDISEAVRNQRRAVQLTPAGHPDLPGRLSNLGNSFWGRFKSTGDLEDLSEALRNQQRADLLTPDGHPELPGQLSNLSWAIQNQQRAVRLTPDRHPDLPGQLSNLGSSFLGRFKYTGDRDDLSQAIENQQRAIQFTPNKHASFPGRLSNLGNSLSYRFEYTGNLNDITEAIEMQRHAVQLTPEGHPDSPGQLSNLGNSFLSRFKYTRDLDDLLGAIRNQQIAVQLTPDGHPDLPGWLDNLGKSFLCGFEHDGNLDDISEAVHFQQRAVQLTLHRHQRHADIPSWLSNLGNSLLARFRYTGGVDDISKAVQYQERAISLTPDSHADLPRQLDNFGNSLFCRFEETGGLDDISEAIQNQQRAIQLTRDGHPDLPGRLSNLGKSFLGRFEHTGDMDDIFEAVRIQQRAVQLTPDGHPDLPGLLSNLGNSLLGHFKCTLDLNNLSQAVENQRHAVRLTPDRHVDYPRRVINLGETLLCYFEHTGDHEYLSTAALNFHLIATAPTGPLSFRLNAAKRWVTLSEHHFVSSQRLEAYACITQLLSDISSLESTVQHRHRKSFGSSRLSLAASAAAFSLGHPNKALEFFVEGRRIVWNQIDQLLPPIDELRAYDPALAAHLSLLSKALENAGLGAYSHTTGRDLSTAGGNFSLEEEERERLKREHLKLSKEWDVLLATIRNIPGFKNFLRPRLCADIMHCLSLPDEGAIVIINVHHDRCDALALMAGADEPVHIPLPELQYQEVKRLASVLNNYLALHGISRALLPKPPGDVNSPFNVSEVLSVLWCKVVKPILEALAFPSDSPAKLSRIWWCPTGPLAFLPIHAAGIYIRGEGVPNQCLSDFAVSSYIPTLDVLLKPSLSVKERGDAPAELLMVSQPNTPSMCPIPAVRDEIEKIKMQLERRGISFCVLDDEKGTVNRVLESMELFPCIHLACHGSRKADTLVECSISLHDGLLPLSDIMRVNLLNSDFAFVSACQISNFKGDDDEAFNFPSGLLVAGYQSVVGTMWCVMDEYCPDIAEDFYGSLLDNATNEGPATRRMKAQQR